MNKDKPGVIYELRCEIDGEWYPFYVGESSNYRMRLAQHRAKSITEKTLVYTFIREELTPNNIRWDIFPVIHYPIGSPDDLEDEHIMNLLQQGVLLKNMKKGNANWMKNMMDMAADMKIRKITSYRAYRAQKEQESLDELTRKAEEKHQQWLIDEAVRKVEIEMEQRREEIRQKQIAQENEKQRQYRAQQEEKARLLKDQRAEKEKADKIVMEQRRIAAAAAKVNQEKRQAAKAAEELRIETLKKTCVAIKNKADEKKIDIQYPTSKLLDIINQQMLLTILNGGSSRMSDYPEFDIRRKALKDKEKAMLEISNRPKCVCELCGGAK